jgi:hypothetical protein
MKKVLLIMLIMAASKSAAGSEFDYVLLERLNYAGLSNTGLRLEPSRLCRPGSGAMVLHTNPYRLDDLYWNFAAARYGWRGLGGYVAFRSYRLGDLYNDVTITVGLAAHLYKGIYSSVSLARRREEFKGDDDFTRSACDFHISYDGGLIVAQVGLEELVTSNPYQVPGGGRSVPVLRATCFASDQIALLAGYRRDEFDRGRWHFGQDMTVTGGLQLRLAYVNNPNTLEWGLDFSYKSLRLGFGYLAANKLNDTVILGFSIGN